MERRLRLAIDERKIRRLEGGIVEPTSSGWAKQNRGLLDFKEAEDVVGMVLKSDDTMRSVEKLFTKEELAAAKQVISAAVRTASDKYAIKPLAAAPVNTKYGTGKHYVIDDDNDVMIEAEASAFDLSKPIPDAKV